MEHRDEYREIIQALLDEAERQTGPDGEYGYLGYGEYEKQVYREELRRLEGQEALEDYPRYIAEQARHYRDMEKQESEQPTFSVYNEHEGELICGYMADGYEKIGKRLMRK